VEFPAALSERLGPLSRDQLQAALDRFDLGALVDVRPTTSGLFGQNVFVTATSGEWVLRGAPHWPWQFAKERFFADQLRRHTRAPVPWPYLVCESRELFGWSYALMPRLPGTPPSELRNRLEPDDVREIARVLGAGLAELQRLGAASPGEYDPERGEIRPSDLPFSDQVAATLDDWRAKLLAIPGALDARDLALIDEVAERAQGALAEPLRPCFVHLDYAQGNVVVERGPDGWRLGGVFDLMTCAFADGEQDLPRMTASLASSDREAARRFIAAYCERGGRRELRPGHRERFRLYMLMDRLILWEYGRRNRVWFSDDASFRDFAERSMSLDSLLGEI
jgi:aminoglycoside phosphotransferase (APT) family kinase protein